MKKHMIRFLFGAAMSICLLASPISAFATDPDTGAEGGEMKEGNGDPGKLPYKSGDRPCYVYSDGYVTGYFVIHIDASYTSMSKDQYEAYAKRYCAATGVEYHEPFGEDIVSDRFAEVITEQAEQYYSTNIEVAHAVAREIHSAKLVPKKSPDLSYDLYWFDYVPEEDGDFHYYIYRGLYYKVNNDVYNAYLALEDVVHDESTVAGLGVGNGAVFFYAEPTESIKSEALYLVYQDKETFEEETIYLNPPNYNNMITLQYGDYQVVGGGLYDDRSFPVIMDYPEFTVVEGGSVEVRVKYSGSGEDIQLAGYTAEEMAAINQQYADSVDYITQDEPQVAPAEFVTNPDQVPEPPKNSRTFWIVMGVVGAIVVGGVVVLIIRKKREEYY